MKNIWKFLNETLTKAFGEERSKTIVTFAKKAWVGDVELWNVFWIYGLLIPLILSFVFIAPLGSTGRLGLSISLLVLSPYFVWMLKSIWACSTNLPEEKYHGVDKIYITYIAKAFAVMGALQYFLVLFG